MFAKAVNKMGYCDAIEDGIETVGGKFGYYYRIPCEICGEKIRRTQYSRKRNYICDYCKGVIKKKQKAKIPEELQDVKTKKELQFDKAIKEIEQQSKCYDEYKKSIEIARKRLSGVETPGKGAEATTILYREEIHGNYCRGGW